MNYLKGFALGFAATVAVFILCSLADIVVSAIQPRFYSTLLFIVIFGVGGIFAGIFCQGAVVHMAKDKTERTRQAALITMIVTGAIYFFPLAELEGGEYEAAFKSFGVGLALSALVFWKAKIEL